MTRVTVLREGEFGAAGEETYRAVGGNEQAAGKTAGKAVDALTARLPEGEGGTLLIVRDLRPDRLFTAEQRRRLGELMGRWRLARDAGQELPLEEREELQNLADAEVEASAYRAEEAWRERP